MTLTELKSARIVAGANYTDAIERLRAAYVELAALDVAWISINGGRPDAGPTFGHLPQNVQHFEHPIFAKIDPSVDWRDAIAAKRDQLLKSFGN